MKKIIIPVVLLLLIIVFFLGFIERDKVEESTTSKGTVYSVTNIPNNLEKITGLSKRDEDFICATSRGLVEKEKDGTIVPCLAKEINVKDNGIEYEFILKNDIYWSDGSKIQASDMGGFLKELIKTEEENNIVPILDIYGAKDFKDNKTTFEKGVAILSDGNILKIRLNKKNENFIEELTKPQYRLRRSLNLWSNMSSTYKNLTYSGLYKIEDMEKDEVTLVKNKKEDFKGEDKISMVVDQNEELAMASFEVGSRDIVLNPPKSQLVRLKDEKKLITMPSNEGIFISNNEELSLVERREIYRIIYNAAEAFEGDNSNRVEAAEGSYFRGDKEDLAKLQTRKVSINKEEEWKKPEVINLLSEDNDETREFCKYLVSWFKDKEGINLRYSLVKSEDLKDIELRKKYNIIMFKSIGNKDELGEFYKNIEGLYTEVEKELFNDEIKKNNLSFTNIEEKLFSSYRILPILFENNNVAISDKLSNISLDGNGNVKFSSIYK